MHRFIAAALVILSVVLLVATTAQLIALWPFADDFPGEALSPAERIASSDPSGFAAGRLTRQTTTPVVLSATVVVEEIHPSDGEIVGHLRLRTTPAFGQLVEDVDPPGRVRKHRSRVTVLVRIRDRIGGPARVLHIDARDLVFSRLRQSPPELLDLFTTPFSSEEGEVRRKIRLSAVPSSSTYPGDSYLAWSDFYFEAVGRSASHRTRVVGLPVQLNLLMMPGTYGFEALAYQPPDPKFGEFMVRLTRQGRIVWYVYAIALTPMLIVLVKLTNLLRGHSGDSLAAAIGVATALLAILSLRQVLVPPEIQSLTFLDVLLGAQVVAIVVAVAVRYAFDLWTKGHEPRVA